MTAVYLLPAPVSTPTGGSGSTSPSPSPSSSTGGSAGLGSVSISISPVSITLTSSSKKRFTATVTGTSNTAVTWSLSPQLGTISAGTYVPPSVISAATNVAVIATSVADPTKSAAAEVYLEPSGSPSPAPSVSISLSPTTVALQGGQTKQFTPTVSGTSNTGVTWSVVPSTVGTVSNGLYTAPTTVGSAQTVSVIATSNADSTKSASASVQLQAPAPAIGVSVSPLSTSLGGGGSIQFSATVTGTSNTAVTWSLSPSVGTITNGLYNAPATVSTQQNVTIIATSAASSAATGQATITLTPPVTSTGSSTVTLPLEVIGANGLTVSATVNIPQGANLTGQPLLWMQIHGLRYQTQASVQVNGGSWVAINSTNVTLLGNAAAYGGIGGGFSTLQMTLALPANSLSIGNNTVAFRFNQTDGRVSGFRVLNFNFLDVNGNQMVPASTFVEDDPNTWQPPSTAASDITAGQTLWLTANLTTPTASGPVAIKAHCTDCHAQDGRDLKYFNYSNQSIEARSVFHGLSAQQGAQIASYIRTLNVVNPGRPWNPPYQPGPGLDEQPVSNWAAGAGIDAVLDNDQELLQAMFPNGLQDASVFSPTGTLNQRELPIPFQLPDWNQWLPGTSPKDAFGSLFTNSAASALYQTIRAGLTVGDATSYKNQAQNINLLQYDILYVLKPQLGLPSQTSTSWTAQQADDWYSVAQWGMVKTWEIMQDFQLEGMAQDVFGPQAEPRAWYSAMPFTTSPHMLGIPNGLLRNGSAAEGTYLAYIWYQLQLTLNDSNRTQSSADPIDWGYSMGYAQNLADFVQPQAALHYLWLIKALQISNNGIGPNVAFTGFNWSIPNMAFQTYIGYQNIWNGVPASTRAALENGIIAAYLQVVTQFTAQQWYVGGWANAAVAPTNSFYTMLGSNDFGSNQWFAIPQFMYFGLDQALVNQWAAWAQTVWPAANWSTLTTATCGPGFLGTAQIQCSTETQ